MGGGQGGCVQRIEVFEKIQKKIGGGGVGLWVQVVGVRVDVNKVFVNIHKKKNFFLGGGGGGGWVWGGCERRIEVFVKIQTKKFFFGGGGVVG